MQGIFKKQMYYVQFSSLMSIHKNPQHFHTHPKHTTTTLLQRYSPPKKPMFRQASLQDEDAVGLTDFITTKSIPPRKVTGSFTGFAHSHVV